MSAPRDIAVLLGGPSAEREVSLASGKACADALERRGHRVRRIDVSRDVKALVDALTPAPDVVFNALHGRFGEDGRIQGILDTLGLPYTHSGLLASAVAMDKPRAKTVFEAAGLRCVEGLTASREQVLAGDLLPRPYVIKPTGEGSSVGVHIVQPGDNQGWLAQDWPFGETVLAERFIPGRELTVAVMGDRPLTVTDIRAVEGFYDYSAKYVEGRSIHELPAKIPAQIFDEAMESALIAHRALGCEGVSRADFRYDDTPGGDGKLYLLEVNTQPGMTSTSLVPEQALHLGISFEGLVEWMVEVARCHA